MRVARVQWLVVFSLVWLLAINVAMAQDDGGEASDETDMDEEGEDEKVIPDEEPNVTGMFHCDRGGMTCLGDLSTCTIEDGTCVCEEELEGYDCGLNKTMEACDKKCRNKGICTPYEVDTEMCYCEDPFFGDVCEYQRVSHECRHDEMDISITPFSNQEAGFKGLLFIKGEAKTEGCQMVEGEMMGTYEGTFPYETCGGPVEVVNDDGDTELTFIVIVTYNDLIQKITDQQFDFTCKQGQSGKPQDFPSDLLKNDDKENPMQQQKVAKDLNPVSLTISLDDGSPVEGPLPIGTILVLTYTLNGGSVYKKLKVEQVIAHNGKEGGDLAELPLVIDGCISEEAGPNGKGVAQELSSPDDNTVMLKFQLFKYPDSEELGLRNTVRACEDGGGECNSTSCEFSTFEAFGRKRRSADLVNEDGDQIEEVTRTIYVYNPNDVRDKYAHHYGYRGTSSEPSLWSCVNNTSFLVIIIILVILLVVALAVFTACCIRALHHQQSAGGGTAYTNKAFA